MVTWASTNLALATVTNGLVMAVAPGVVTVTATSEGHSGTATETALITGLDFPGNVNWPATSPSMLFVWNATLSGTAPFAAYPATYIWRVFPRAHDGFWTFLFHAKCQPPVFDQEFANQYYLSVAATMALGPARRSPACRLAARIARPTHHLCAGRHSSGSTTRPRDHRIWRVPPVRLLATRRPGDSPEAEGDAAWIRTARNAPSA